MSRTLSVKRRHAEGYISDGNGNPLSIAKDQDNVGVSVSQIYIQIAKYSGNSQRERELVLLSKAVSSKKGNGHSIGLKYVPMKMQDVKFCFGSSYEKLPRGAIVSMNG